MSSFEDDLRNMPIGELRKYAKSRGIKANMKTEKIIEALLEKNNEDSFVILENKILNSNKKNKENLFKKDKEAVSDTPRRSTYTVEDEDSFLTLERKILNSHKKNKERLFDQDKEIVSDTPRRETYTVDGPSIELTNSLVEASASPELKKPGRKSRLSKRKVSFVTPLRRSTRFSCATPVYHSVKDRPKTPMPNKSSTGKRRASSANNKNDVLVEPLDLDASVHAKISEGGSVKRPSTPMPVSKQKKRLSSMDSQNVSLDNKQIPDGVSILNEIPEDLNEVTNAEKAVTPISVKRTSTPLPAKKTETPLPIKRDVTILRTKKDATPFNASNNSATEKGDTPLPAGKAATHLPAKKGATPLPARKGTNPLLAKKAATPLASRKGFTPLLGKSGTRLLPVKKNSSPLTAGKNSFITSSSKKNLKTKTYPEFKKITTPISKSKTLSPRMNARSVFTPGMKINLAFQFKATSTPRTKLESAKKTPTFQFKATSTPRTKLESAKKTPNFKKLHQKEFAKMESIDDYQQRKLRTRAEKAKEHRRFHTPAKANNNVKKFVAEKKKKIPKTYGGITFIPTAESTRSLQIKQKQAQTNSATSVKTLNEKVLTRRLKKARNVKGVKSISRENSILKQRYKFDLEASLKKKLPYKPHSGPLKPLGDISLNSSTITGTPSVVTKLENQLVRGKRIESREVLRGVRKNRRFDLQMNNRNLNMSEL